MLKKNGRDERGEEMGSQRKQTANREDELGRGGEWEIRANTAGGRVAD